jgi:mannose-6-phosphate isomerase-like protein (cupin superfamily)
MHAVHESDLPFRGMSRRFVGAEQGNVGISAYLVSAPPGRGPVLHRHPYDEVAFIRAGRGRWTVDGVEREAGPGDILVVKAGEVHSFINIGEEPLIQVDIHLGPHFVQEDLPDSAPR